MQTGEPGSQAQVSNSGDEHNAVFDFVIPKGDTGTSGECTSELLNAYSTPAKPGDTGTALVFDQNGSMQGTAIAHTEGSSQITISQPGFYFVSFHGSIAPINCLDLPLSLILGLQQQGVDVPGAEIVQNLQNAQEVNNVSFTQIVKVTSVPSVLQIVASGGRFLYSDISVSIFKLADVM